MRRILAMAMSLDRLSALLHGSEQRGAGAHAPLHTVMDWVYAAAMNASRQFCMVARWLRH